MGDAEARVVGAGDVISVNGKEITLAPIDMKQLYELQRAALSYYKREYLSTYAENLDLLPKKQASGLLEAKLEEVAKWDSSNLPLKMSFDIRNFEVTDKLKKRLEGIYGDIPDGQSAKTAVLSTALDSGEIKPEEVERLTGKKPRRVRIPYDMWWVTAVFDGMVAFVHASVSVNSQGITRDEVGRWPLAKVMEAARVVESLTAPVLGNT